MKRPQESSNGVIDHRAASDPDSESSFFCPVPIRALLSFFRKKSTVFGWKIRATAATLVIAMIFQAVLLPAAQAGAMDTATGPTLDVRDGVLRNKKVYRPDGPTIFHIEDAHARMDAQEKIGRILDDLTTQYDLRLIALEGSDHTLDTTLIGSFPMEKVRTDTAREFLEEGRISAAEFYAMTSNKPLMLEGVEKGELYRRDREVLSQLILRRPEIQLGTASLDEVFGKASKRFDTEALYCFKKKRALYRKGSVTFSEYWPYLLTIWETPENRGKIFPEALKRLSQITKLEAKINFKKAALEREQAIEDLSRRLPEQAFRKWVLLSLRYKNGEITAWRFHRELFRLLRGGSSAPERAYPQLAAYLRYLGLYEHLDLYEVIAQMDGLEETLARRLARTSEQRELLDLETRWELCRSMLRTSCSGKLYDRYRLNPEAYRWEGFVRDLKALYRNIPEPSVNEEALESLGQAFRQAENFYNLAYLRNQDLFKNTLKKMKEKHTRVAALVTGGFHSEGMHRLMERQEVTHMVLVPRLDGKGKNRPYLTVLTHRPREEEERWAAEGDYLAVVGEYSSQEAFARLLVRAASEGEGSLGISEGKVSDDLAQAHLERYRQAQSLAGLSAEEQRQNLETLSAWLQSFRIRVQANGFRVQFGGYDFSVVAGSDGKFQFFEKKKIPGVLERTRRLFSKVNPFPELILSAAVVLTGTAVGLPGLCLLAVGLRLGWGLAVLIHEAGHLAMKRSVDSRMEPGDSGVLSRLLVQAALSSIPFTPIYVPGWTDEALRPKVGAGDTEPWKVRLKALAGPGANAVVLTAFWFLLTQLDSFFGPSADGSVSSVMIMAAKLLSMGSVLALFLSWTDLASFLSGTADALYCGNFGVIARRHHKDGNELLPERISRMTHRMGSQTEVRGEQAAGGAVEAMDSAERPVHIGTKVVNSKRDNLTQALEEKFTSVRKKALRSGNNAPEIIKAFYHYRYGTSSAPAVKETHWHEWLPAREVDRWVLGNGHLEKEKKRILNIKITHNGDFDAYKIFGTEVDNTILGMWLHRVLGGVQEALGDSPKIAGMMDLLHTQGMWDASVRLAYQLAVAGSVNEAFGGQDPSQYLIPLFGAPHNPPTMTWKSFLKKVPNTAPSAQQIKNWASIFEEVFKKHQAEILASGAGSLENVPEAIQDKIIHEVESALRRNLEVSRWPNETIRHFAKEGVSAFFQNNLHRATIRFLNGAVGDFGLVTASTFDPGHLVLSSAGRPQGQPMFIGKNPSKHYQVYASELAAVVSALASDPEDETFWCQIDPAGEVIRIGSESIEIFSLPMNRKLSEEEVDKSRRWVPLKNNPYMTVPHAADEKDPVSEEIRRIPGVVSDIRRSASDPRSYNPRTMRRLIGHFLDKCRQDLGRREKKVQAGLENTSDQSATIDLLLVGIENSQWVDEKFADDLRRQYPGLNVQAVSSNKVLERGSQIPIGPDTLVLVVSQSGQTYPSLQATRYFESLRKKGKILDLFVLTGEVVSLMGDAIGQKYHPDSPFSERIFINHTGRSVVEPSTMTVIATHEVLTQILFDLGEAVHREFGDERPYGNKLNQEGLAVLASQREQFHENLGYIAGANGRGDVVSTDENRRLTEAARRWARHVTEPAVTWGLSACYVAVSVIFKAPLFSTLTKLVSAFSIYLGHPVPELAGECLAGIALLMDAALYIWFPWVAALFLRYFQGRPLMARLGKRTLVIGEDAFLNPVLESYVSKLFSLSYGIASLDVHGANPSDHMLHRFGHRVVRGTLLWLGVPDGRLNKRQLIRQKSVLMTGKQAKGVANLGASAEVFSVGKNPAVKTSGFDQFFELPEEGRLSLKDQPEIVSDMVETRFDSIERALAANVFFWALARRVASLPWLHYEFWKSQSRTNIATTMSPTPGISADEPLQEVGDETEKRSPEELLKEFQALEEKESGSAGSWMAQFRKDIAAADSPEAIKPLWPFYRQQLRQSLERVQKALEVMRRTIEAQGDSPEYSPEYSAASTIGSNYIRLIDSFDQEASTLLGARLAVLRANPLEARLKAVVGEDGRALLASDEPVPVVIAVDHSHGSGDGSAGATDLRQSLTFTAGNRVRFDTVMSIGRKPGPEVDLLVDGYSDDAVKAVLDEIRRRDRKAFEMLEPVVLTLLGDGTAPDKLSPEKKRRILDLLQEQFPQPAPRSILITGQGIGLAPEVVTNRPESRSRSAEGLARAVDRLLFEALSAPDRPILNEASAAWNRLNEALWRFFSPITADTEATFDDQWEALREASSKTQTARWALTDPSYRMPMQKLLPSLSADTKTILTDLEVFTKDADGLPYALRLRHLERTAPGRFHHVLVVRDPLLPDKRSLLERFPQASIFGDQIIFAPSLKSLDELQGYRPQGVRLDGEVVCLAPASAKLHHAKEFTYAEQVHQATFVELDEKASTTVLFLEVGVLAGLGCVLPAFLKKMPDGSYLFELPPVIPVTQYLAETRRVLNALQSAA